MSHRLHHFNSQYKCIMADPDVQIRFDNVVLNYFGEQMIPEQLKEVIYNKLWEVKKLIRDYHECDKQIQDFLVHVLDIQKVKINNIIQPKVVRKETKLQYYSNKIYEGCPMYIPKNLTLTQLNDILQDNIPITIDAKTKGFKR